MIITVIIKINLEMTTKFNFPSKCPLTFLILLDKLQDINSKVSWNIIRFPSLVVKEAFSCHCDEP